MKKKVIVEQRRHERHVSHNMVAYTGVDLDQNEIAGRVGRTLDISEGGILLETYTLLEPRSCILLEIGLGEDIVKMTGTVVYSRKGRGKHFRTGIALEAGFGEKSPLLARYIDAFKKAKKKRT